MTVTVGAMTDAQSARLVTADSVLDPAEVHAVLEQVAGWPLLLSLINSEIRSLLRHGCDAHEAVERITERLSSDGPIAFDPTQPEHRAQAVSSTIGASLTVLAERDRKRGTDLLDRYLELAVFPGGIDIPQETLEKYWHHTGELSVSSVTRLCAELADLSLIHYDAYRRCLQMHTVIREYLGDRASGRLAQFNQRFLDTYRVTLPRDNNGETGLVATRTIRAIPVVSAPPPPAPGVPYCHLRGGRTQRHAMRPPMGSRQAAGLRSCGSRGRSAHRGITGRNSPP